MSERVNPHGPEVGKFPHTNLVLHKKGAILEKMRPFVTAGEMYVNADSLNRQEWTFEGIQTSIAEATGSSLPGALVSDLGLPDLQWQLIVRQNAGAAIFLGASGSHNGAIHLRDALGIVELDARLGKNREVIPQDIHISGVLMDTAENIRTVGYHFRSDEEASQSMLKQAHVSASALELPYVDYGGTIFHDISDEYQRITRTIPSTLNPVGYDVSALSAHITQAQKDQTDNHERALGIDVFSTTPRLGFADYPNPGYKIETDEVSYILRFNPKTTRANKYGLRFESDIHSWSVSLPKSLESVAV